MAFCDKCPKKCDTKLGLLQHKYDKHGVGKSSHTSWRCDRCRKSFSAEHILLGHKEYRIHDLEDLLDNFKPDDINRYISGHLQMGWSYNYGCGGVSDNLAYFFQRINPLFKIIRIIKGGSLQKGTAIRPKSGIDLVMFISELPSVDSPNYSRQLEHHLEQVKDALIATKKAKKSALTSTGSKRRRRQPREISFIKRRVEVVGRSNHAVKLRVYSWERKHAAHDVEILLAKDLLEADRHWIAPGKKEEVYTMMGRMSSSARENCSAALVELQVAFVEKQPKDVKDLIRMVKMWKPLILDPANPYNNVADCCRDWDAVARAAEDTLRKPFFSRYIAYNLEVLGRTSHAVKLRVKTQKRDHESHDVDLLLATDLLGPDPTSARKTEVYALMGSMSSRMRESCSAALVELQRDFVKKQPAEVKDLIRLVKMWKKSCVREKSLTSYPLELLCIHTWRYNMSVTDAFKTVLEQLCNYRSIKASWAENYTTARKQILDQRPLILDPANPYNNVADRCRGWPSVARAAEETLQKPFFSR
uniref:C2H2-type domain-containing protein n=1 Tax=Branchiostoma floridae TaxID=7739 RepID=C3YU75_BRAFL|eukprot:XP_002600340.1 hypothetical protein BRAFLDRAFT_66573 [Branchiostoma floridae]